MRGGPVRDAWEQRWWGICLFCIGTSFLLSEALLGNSMSPNTYGFAAYDVDAATWAKGFMAGSALVLYGLYINGRWPIGSPALRALGWAMMLYLFLFLAYSAAGAEDGVHIVLFNFMLFIPRCIQFVSSNVRDLLDRRRA